MADSYWSGTTPGGTNVFTVPFPYLQQADVQVSLNGVVLLTPGDYIWNTAGSIQFNQNVPSGQTLVIQRATSPDNSDVSFNNGAILTAADLNTAVLQTFYRTQELQDQLNTYITNGVLRYQTNGSNPATNVTDLLNSAADAALQTSLAQELLNSQTDINTNANNILTNTNQISTLQATVDNLTSGVPGGIGTYLTNETNARIAGDSALQSTFNVMGAISGGGNTFTINTSNVYVDSVTSMATKFSGLLSSINSNAAAITSEATTRATGDSTNATAITGVQAIAVSKNITFNQSATPTALAVGDLWMDSGNGNVVKRWNGTTWVNVQDAAIATNSAAIATEQTARANGDSANASSITSLTTTVNGNTANISSQLTSINGLEAQYVVKVDVNGHVSGFGLASGSGGTSNFTILANSFSVIDPGNGLTSPIVPFTVSGGVVSMQNVVIGNALIANLAVGKLTSGVLTAAITQNADITAGTGKVVWDNGAYMKVIGVGFGTSNQFIEWFGAHLSSYNSCSETNAIAYLKTNGTAYFGGTLLAGKLTNATQATVLSTSNVADLGPFASNGGTVTITWSYLFHGNVQYPGTSQGQTNYNNTTFENPSAQLILSRSENGGAFSDVLTINISNGSNTEVSPSVPDVSPGYYYQSMSGSGTYTDPHTNTNTREYKLRINSWTNVDTNVDTNTLSIQSSE